MSSNNSEQTENSLCQATESMNLGSIKVQDGSKAAVETSPKIKTQICESNNMQNSTNLIPEESSAIKDNSVPGLSHSEELFVDSCGHSIKKASAAKFYNSDERDQLSCLNRTPDCSLPLPKLEPSENHIILFSTDINPDKVPCPYPSSYTDKWNSDHVRMPCSPLNTFPVADNEGKKAVESKWDLICRSLRGNIKTSQDLEVAIMKYNSKYTEKWNFLGLHDFINKHLTDEERKKFFEVTLPSMIEMALDLPNVCTQPIPFLKKDKDHCISISQKQIGCLLLNAFFCTFPGRNLPNIRNKKRWTCEFATYPDINFSSLFFGSKDGVPYRNAEKLKCLFNYFQRITAEDPTGVVTFHRQSLQDEDFPKWHASTKGIQCAVIKSSGLIECDGYGMLQVDFADEFVGGLVLRQGCVQEEIRFLICPELIVSRLFVERLEKNEVLIVTGVEQYSKYSGYADNFKWEGNFKDKTPRDSWGRRNTQLVAMDATRFTNSKDQYELQFIKRELNKAYCAFYENSPPAHLPAVATGNWGCGVFKGNPNLKFLIQLMAASQTGRSLLYFTFGDDKLKAQLQKMYKFLNEKNLVVGDIYQLLMRYKEEGSLSELYDFIYNQFSAQKEQTKKK